MIITKKHIKIGLILIAVVFIASAYVGMKIYRYAFGSDIVNVGNVYIPSGTTKMDLKEIFPDSMFKNPRYAHEMWKHYNPQGVVRSGYYVIPKGISLRKMFNILRGGLQTAVRVVLNPTRTMEQLAGMVSKFIEVDSAAMYAKLSDPLTAEYFGFKPETFIGMFLPDTYEFYWNVSIDDFLKKMQRQYELFWNQERRDKAKEMKMSVNEIMTLASIVSEESNISEDMKLIAGVYINRLRIGMPLQADPTVRYAVGDFTLKRILKRHTEVNSPYNTYLRAGLPPGPICIPSKAAIDAVLNYKSSKYLYFCASDDFSGRHKFARSLTEHNRNAAAYQRALNRARIR